MFLQFMLSSSDGGREREYRFVLCILFKKRNAYFVIIEFWILNFCKNIHQTVETSHWPVNCIHEHMHAPDVLVARDKRAWSEFCHFCFCNSLVIAN